MKHWVPAAVCLSAAIAAWGLLSGGGAPPEAAPEPDAGPPADLVETPPSRQALRAAPASRRPTIRALYEAWAKAVALHQAGKSKEALALLGPMRKEAPAFFADPERAALLAEMEAATRPKPPPAPAGPAAIPPLSAAARASLEARLAASAPIVASIANPADRERLNRFLTRFVAPPAVNVAAGKASLPRGPWQDVLLGAVAQDAAQRPVKGGTLTLADAEAAERRRLEELENLRQRDVLALLDAIAGGLAWLAIHQADDGRVSDPASLARCRVLHPKEPCPLPGGADVEVATTALTALAFLDFRDQDARGLFEPALARAVRRLLAFQKADGSFGGRRQYSTGMALMALGQAAASTGADDVRTAVRKGIQYLSLHQGADGGWRYGAAIEVGDLSATGWVAQALEAAHGVVDPPPAVRVGLDRFLHDVWLGTHRFSYMARGPERSPLNPVGMLVARIVGDPDFDSVTPEWTRYLQSMPSGARPDLYSLYYGVRMSIALTGNLGGPWRKWVLDLSAEQETKGAAAGCYRRSGGRFAPAGTTGITAATILTLEHALYLR